MPIPKDKDDEGKGKAEPKEGAAGRGRRGLISVSEREELAVEEFIRKERALSDIGIRENIVRFLLGAYGFSLVATFGLLYLEGLGWISLGKELMNWLGGAIIGELAGLFALVIKGMFGGEG